MGSINTTRSLELARALISDNQSYLNIPVNSYLGGSLDSFVNSFFKRKSVKWVALKRKRVGFRHLRLFFFNVRKSVATRGRGRNPFKYKIGQNISLQKRNGGFALNTDVNSNVKRFFKKKVSQRALAAMFFRELMFNKRKSMLRTAYLRKCLYFVRAVREIEKNTINTADRKVPS